MHHPDVATSCDIKEHQHTGRSLVLSHTVAAPSPAVDNTYRYVSSSNDSFILHTTATDFATAERSCNMDGGHLVYYTSLAEQQEVEQYFVMLGVLYPSFTPAYWLGLRSSRIAWPRFEWMSYLAPAPDRDAYEHWGVGDTWREPDNKAGGEYCGAANYTELFDEAWGWADNNCTQAMPYMCKVDGESRLAPCSVWPFLE